MITTLIVGLLVSSVLNTSPTPKTYIASTLSQVINNDSYTTYLVKNGDYLSRIANELYGNEDYWTNIWNDNPELEDPGKLEANTVLKIRDNKTVLPEALNIEFTDRLNSQVKKTETVYTYTAKAGAVAKQVAVEPTPMPVVSQQPIVTPVQVGVDVPRSLTEEQITYLGNCEAGMDPAKNTGNGFYGAFQFSYGTWKSMNTGFERADLAPLEVQKAAVKRLVQRSSIFTQFPACSRRMRSIGMV